MIEFYGHPWSIGVEDGRKFVYWENANGFQKRVFEIAGEDDITKLQQIVEEANLCYCETDIENFATGDIIRYLKSMDYEVVKKERRAR